MVNIERKRKRLGRFKIEMESDKREAAINKMRREKLERNKKSHSRKSAEWPKERNKIQDKKYKKIGRDMREK